MILTRAKFPCLAARISERASPNDGQRSGNVVRERPNAKRSSLNAVGLVPVSEDILTNEGNTLPNKRRSIRFKVYQ